MSRPVYFVHISDTHFGPTKDFELYGCNSYTNAARMVEAINALPTQPDFVVHTGDVASNPDEQAYRLAAEVFERLQSPIYYVTGNHDSSTLIARFLRMGEKRNASTDAQKLSYVFDLHGYRFLTLDARGPDEIDPHGVLGGHQFEFLQSVLDRDAMPLTLFVHFPPLELDSLWLDREMLLLNGRQLHEMLVPHRQRICGVFYGHVHRGIQVAKDGILYSSVASTGGQFSAWPHQKNMQLDAHHPPCCSFVTIVEGKTIVKEQCLPA